MKEGISLKNQLKALNNGATWLLASTIIVNAGNYAINLGLARFLGPEIFAEANILATMVLVLSFIGVGVQLMGSKFVAEAKAVSDEQYISQYHSYISKKINIVAIILTSILVLSVFFIKSYLQFSSVWPLLILFSGLIIYLQLSHKRGVLQGIQSFKELAKTYFFEMVGRVVGTVVLIGIMITLELPYLSEAVAGSFLVSFLWGIYAGNLQIVNSAIVSRLENHKTIIQFLIVIGLYELSQILINNSDVILIKHYFEADTAGKYASLALVGRIVFFATWTIVTLLFPKVIEREKQGKSHAHLFWGALAIVGIVGASISLSCYMFDSLIVNILFGDAYTAVSTLLWLYAVATTFFSCANVFAYYFLSLSKYLPAAFTLVAGMAQVILIIFFHDSIAQVILVQIYLMIVLFTLMCAYYWIHHRWSGSQLKVDNVQIQFEP